MPCMSALRENPGESRLGPLWIPLPSCFAYIEFALYPFDVINQGPGDDRMLTSKSPKKR